MKTCKYEWMTDEQIESVIAELKDTLKFRSERREAGLKKTLACGHVLKAGDVTWSDSAKAFRIWVGNKPDRWIWHDDSEQVGRAFNQDAQPDERIITTADAPELARQNFPLDKIPDPALRAAVEKLRSPSPAATRTAFDAEKIDIERAREGIERVTRLISKCLGSNPKPDDLVDYGIEVGGVRVALGLPAYPTSTIAPSPAGGGKP